MKAADTRSLLYAARVRLERLSEESEPRPGRKVTAVREAADAVAAVLRNPAHPLTRRVVRQFEQTDEGEVETRLLNPDPAWNTQYDAVKPTPLLLFAALHSRAGARSVAELFRSRLHGVKTRWTDKRLKATVRSGDPEATFWNRLTLAMLAHAIKDVLGQTPPAEPAPSSPRTSKSRRVRTQPPSAIAPPVASDVPEKIETETASPKVTAQPVNVPTTREPAYRLSPSRRAAKQHAPPLPSRRRQTPTRSAIVATATPDYACITIEDIGVRYQNGPLCELDPAELRMLRKLADACGREVAFSDKAEKLSEATMPTKSRLGKKLDRAEFQFCILKAVQGCYRLRPRPPGGADPDA